MHTLSMYDYIICSLSHSYISYFFHKYFQSLHFSPPSVNLYSAFILSLLLLSYTTTFLNVEIFAILILNINKETHRQNMSNFVIIIVHFSRNQHLTCLVKTILNLAAILDFFQKRGRPYWQNLSTNFADFQ